METFSSIGRRFAVLFAFCGCFFLCVTAALFVYKALIYSNVWLALAGALFVALTPILLFMRWLRPVLKRDAQPENTREA